MRRHDDAYAILSYEDVQRSFRVLHHADKLARARVDWTRSAEGLWHQRSVNAALKKMSRSLNRWTRRTLSEPHSPSQLACARPQHDPILPPPLSPFCSIEGFVDELSLAFAEAADAHRVQEWVNGTGLEGQSPDVTATHPSPLMSARTSVDFEETLMAHDQVASPRSAECCSKVGTANDLMSTSILKVSPRLTVRNQSL